MSELRSDSLHGPRAATIDSDLDDLGHAGRRAHFGDKGADLWEFARWLRDVGANVPSFRLYDTGLLDDHRHRAGPPPVPRHPGLPTYFSVDAEILDWAAGFAPDMTLDGCAVKSSLVWPDGGPRPSGVDLTAFVGGPADRAAVLTWVAAAFAKAHTTLCLRMAGHDTAVAPRSGLIVMEAIAPALVGTAFLSVDGVKVLELGAFDGSTTPGTLPPRTAAELDRLLDLLVEQVPVGSVGEVELLVDPGGDLHLLQFALRSAGPGPLPALSVGVGAASGPLLDLRGTTREQDLDARLTGSGRPVVAIPLYDLERMDAFSLAWVLTAGPTLPRPAAVVVTLPAGPLAGPPLHLRSALREWLPQTLIVSAPDSAIPSGSPLVQVVGDGVRARLLA